ncbi:MAG: hypothetical protein ACT4N4_07765 [Rhodospirillales bacterium]
MERTITCYAEGSGDRWEAICLDFDIAVQGGSFDDVYRGLRDSIALYLDHVATLPEADRRRLLARRAPLAERMKFAYHAFRTGLGFNGGGGKQRHEFLLPCAA